MSSSTAPVILSIDDDEDMLRLVETFLAGSPYRVLTTGTTAEAMQLIKQHHPDLILLDVIMPEMNGYEFCSQLQQQEETAYIPVVFVTALEEDEDRARAFSVGAVDYLVKPFNKKTLTSKIETQTRTSRRWKELSEQRQVLVDQVPPSAFADFREFLAGQLALPPEEKEKLRSLSPSRLYTDGPGIGISEPHMAQYVAGFLRLTYLPLVNPEDIKLGALPAAFCLAKPVVPVADAAGKTSFVLSNPFDWELLDLLDAMSTDGKTPELLVSEPRNILSLFQRGPGSTVEGVLPEIRVLPLDDDQPGTRSSPAVPELESQKHPVPHMASTILQKAVFERASDIHIEPNGAEAIVRFRVDGEMKDILTLKKRTSTMLISHLKATAGLDIAEKRRPQDGSLEVLIDGNPLKLRLATASTPEGENLTVRLLETQAKRKTLKELGMSDEQAATLIELVHRTHGLIAVVGPTGSGKTTTLYSLLGHVDCSTRNLISVEDPVEYRIPYANQQQVNEKAGITFETLLRSVVRQDPDILFLGEMRDQSSARSAVDFASTGHMTITTLHTSNATTAVFRLERMGIDRGTATDTVLAIVAQRLVKKLCPYCKEKVATSPEEAAMLSPFTDAVPAEVAHPVGCLKCSNSGYHGREGIFEVLTFDNTIREMVRSEQPVSAIRQALRMRGEVLISHHAVEKIRNLVCSPGNVYEKVLVEETDSETHAVAQPTAASLPAPAPGPSRRHVLIVDDDEDICRMVTHLLESAGHRVTAAEDAVSALLEMGKSHVDLIISDVNMPGLDGFKLVELISRRAWTCPWCS